MLELSPFVHRALVFAAKAHTDVCQVRKYTGEPYIVHPIEVMMITSTAAEYDEDMLAAALLHDVVEDTPVELWQINAQFGDRVSELVHELTEPDWPGNRKARKAAERGRLAQISPAAQTVKLADLISNSGTIVTLDPDFARVYLREKAAILQVMTKGDAVLYERARSIIPTQYWEEANG